MNKIKEEAIKYKGSTCEICGYNKCSAAFDFHHLNTNEKDFNISKKMTSFKAIKAELDKTVLLCCRCHREVHDGMHPTYLDVDDKYS